MLRQVMLALLVFVAGHAAAADERWPLGRLALPEAAVAMEKAGDGALLRLSDGSYRRVIWDEGGAALEPAAAPERESAPDMLPDGDVVRGEGTIRRAWLAAPTSRYDHAILGDGIEAAELRVETADGETLVYDAPHDTVFEDLTPRLWDLDGDGEAEVWVVRSGPIEGARFEAYTVREGALRLRMATEPIGQGHRWLNPVGMGDFTGAGSLEVALVKTPHIGGILTVYRRDGLALDPVALVPGVSNHSIGSREMGLSWIGDIDGDGAADILIPGKSRRELVALRLPGGKFQAIGASGRSGHIQTDLVELSLPKGGRAIVFADDGPALRWLRLPD